MKTTTTIMDMLQSELINEGFDEFSSKNQIHFFDDEFQFIKKVMKYDDDVARIVNRMFFHESSLNSVESDTAFKKMFVNKFLNRQIKFQTVEEFSAQVTYTFYAKQDYLNELYDNLEDYLQGTQTTTNTGNQNTLSDNRQLMSELPQNNINLNVDDTVLDYGNMNSINRNRTNQENDGSSESKQFDMGTLLELNGLLEQVFDTFDSNCFLQIW